MWVVTLVAALGSSNVLDGAAASSPRPEVCEPTVGFWARFSAHDHSAFCASLAKAYARLARQPELAEQDARRALKQLQHPAARVALARALTAQRRYGPAWEQFTHQAQSSAPSGERQGPASLAMAVQALGGTGALHDFACAAALQGRSQVALEAYRRLVPRLELLPQGEHVGVLVEAAMAVLRSGGAVEEAAAYAANAQRRRMRRANESYLLALEVLLRRVRGSSAGEADELDRTWLQQHLAGEIRWRAPHLPRPELTLLLALVTEPSDPALAREIVQQLPGGAQGLAAPLREQVEQWWPQASR